MAKKRRVEECRLCVDDVAEAVERFFCDQVGKEGVDPERCRRLMEKRRKKEISYPELLKELKLDEESFERNLDLALDRLEKAPRPEG